MHENLHEWMDVADPPMVVDHEFRVQNRQYKPSALGPNDTFFDHSSARRVNTDTVIATAIKEEHPKEELTIIPAFTAPLLIYAAAGYATAVLLEDNSSKCLENLIWRIYIPASRRADNSPGSVGSLIKFAKYGYEWQGKSFYLYIVDGRDGGQGFPTIKNQYLVGPLSSSSEPSTRHKHGSNSAPVVDLIVAAGHYDITLHNEIWVFDGGYWQKDAALYSSVMKSRWEDVILDESMKKTLQTDVSRFFDNRSRYQKLRVPWKRGGQFIPVSKCDVQVLNP